MSKLSLDDRHLRLIVPDSGATNSIPVPTGNLGRRIFEAQQSGQVPYIIIISVMGEEAAVDIGVK